VARLPQGLRRRLHVSQQARPEDLAAVVTAYREAGVSADIESFFADVPQRLARAHLVICRAGASTVAELGAVGRPALLIPYPHATDDHQTANAAAFAAAGGGRAIRQADLGADGFAAELEKLLGDGAVLLLMAQRAAAFGRRDAARRLADLALSLRPGEALEECAA
jgi:UDP-N-acetylglucosamine--N-acetylmuramyl-(pentapeptide) pyrophosphoryl-undecaprenol N-acetylglucosamine transferase